MKHVIIGTAGHVDHGKSSLIKALTGLSTDRLKEEQKRGITIELGFAWLDLPDGSKAGIVDVPGHEKFVHNMLAGAGGIDLALLVVAADEGVMPQTVEHLEILKLLNIQHGMVVITKTDLVEEDWIELAVETVKESIEGTFFENADVFQVSAYTGEGIDELREAIFQTLACLPEKDHTIPFREPIDRVFSVEGFGTVITGTIFEGTVATGDTLMLYPQEQEVRVRNIQVHENDVEKAFAGQRTAINLAQVSKDEVERGQILAAKNSMDCTQILDVHVSVSDNAPFAIKNRSRLHFHYGSAEAICQIRLFDREELEPGDKAVARLLFREDIAVRHGDPFVLRFYSPVITLGGGRVLDTAPQTRKIKNEEWQQRLTKLLKEDHQTRLFHMIDTSSPNFASIQQAYRRSGLSELSAEVREANLKALLETGMVYQLTDEVYLSKNFVERLGDSAEGILRKFHEANPLKSGMKREALRTTLLSDVKLEYTDKVLDRLASERQIVISDGIVSSPNFELKLTENQEEIQAEILKMYKEAGFTPPELEDVTGKFPSRENPLALLSNLIDRGELVRLDEKLNIHPVYISEAKEFIISSIETQGSLKLADFRDYIGSSRKYAVAILDYFDRIKLTRLKDDVRILL